METPNSTEQVKVPQTLLGQIIGQEDAVRIVRLAAKSGRHLLLVGQPGCGKSMLGQALSQLIPPSNLGDMISCPNEHEPTRPQIKLVMAGGAKLQLQASKPQNSRLFILMFISFLIGALIWWAKEYFSALDGKVAGAIYTALFSITGLSFLAYLFISWKPSGQGECVALLSRKKGEPAPFIDATGAPVASLLGDIQHDPYQTGGLGTPPHKRVQLGLIHRAHGGVLFIDEIGTFPLNVQQELLTALQEGEFPVLGRNETSAGAGVRTDPVPCKFILVAAGNIDSVHSIHPALRDRIRGYGYEILMKDEMEDNGQNHRKLWQFIAQEVKRDRQIPHFSAAAAAEVIRQAHAICGRKNKLTLRLRLLGGIIRAAGDLALWESAKEVQEKHVRAGAKISLGIEDQILSAKLVKR